nr:hypothetical protein [Propionivibrio sp.]
MNHVVDDQRTSKTRSKNMPIGRLSIRRRNTAPHRPRNRVGQNGQCRQGLATWRPAAAPQIAHRNSSDHAQGVDFLRKYCAGAADARRDGRAGTPGG